MVRVTFLGSGDAFGSGGRFQACILLTGGPAPLLLDCGATSLVALKRASVDPASLGLVLVSHLHGDHFGGVPFLVLDGQFSRREQPLVVAGPVGTAERVSAAMEVLFPGSSTATRRFETSFVELSPGEPSDLGIAVVTPFPADHPSGAPALSLRVAYGGRVIAYSGDTAWTAALPDVARDTDLFICEGYAAGKAVPYHMRLESLRENLQMLRARRVVLTHMGPDVLARPGEHPFEYASDGATFDV